jgi:adenylate cyclase class 2
MPVEIEAKMHVKDIAKVRRRLEELGAKHEGDVIEVNTFFDTDDHALVASDKGLRLRTKRPLAGGETTFVITYKGPRHYGELKTREEFELKVNSDDDAIKLFDKLGYRKVLSFQKKRRTYAIDGCLVELDELPYLGTFVEIEGPNDAAVMKLREKIGLADHVMVRASYAALLTSWLQEKGRADRDIVFVDQPGTTFG